MKNKTLLLILGLLLSYQAQSQRKKAKYIFTASTINFYPELKSHSFFSEAEIDQDLLILNFLTATSGTFNFEDVRSTFIDIENKNRFPSQIFNFGLSFQFRNQKSVFHQFSISRFSYAKSSFNNIFSYTNLDGMDVSEIIGYNQRSFVLSLRYEYGKVFGKIKSRIRFGISGVFEPSFYSYRREVASIQEFPINANIHTLGVGLSPSLSFKLSKKVFLDFKVLPTILFVDLGSVSIENPVLSPDGREGIRIEDLPELSITGTIQVRYLLKEPKKRRRRSKE
jgi:hypothetical protein